MKRFFLIIMSFLFFYLFSISNSEGIQIENVAYCSINSTEEFSTNVVITKLISFIQFNPTQENEKVQNLTQENKINIRTELKLFGDLKREVYLKTTYSNKVYAEIVKFYITNALTGEKVEIKNNEENNQESVSFILEGNQSYYIDAYLEDIKNTANITSSLFSLVLLSKENNEVLGLVQNELLIKNSLIFLEHEENIKEQTFSKEKGQNIVGKIYFDNISNEEVYFTGLADNNIKYSKAELFIENEPLKIEYDPILKKYKSEKIKLKSTSKVELFLKNPEYIGDIEKGTIALELNYNDEKYGEVRNTIKYKEDKKILIEKIAKNDIVSIGDLVKYEVIIKNSLDEEYETLTFTDFLPKGMSLLKESVKASKNFKIKEINQKKNNEIDIVLSVGNNSKSVETEKITYLARVNATAKEGRNINTVKVLGKTILGQTFSSNEATAQVEIDKDNFYDKGIIVGLVYLDLDGDNLYTKSKDIGVPGVKIFLENGDFAITDRHGKYSIYGEEAVTHIAKIYKNTMPLGLKAKQISSLYSKNGESKFVDLKKAQLDRADFALTLNGEKDLGFIKKIIEKRFETLAQDSYELDKAIEGKFLETRKLGDENELSNERGILDNGKELDIESIRNTVLFSEIKQESAPEVKKNLTEEWNLIPDYKLEYEISKMNNELEFLNVKDKDLIPEYMSFQVKGPGEGTLKLFANGKEISPGQITLTAKSPMTNTFFLEYASVKLEKGKNKLKLSYHDMFGAERFSKEIEVYVRGKYEEVKIKVVDNEQNQTLKKIIVEGVDEYGHSIDHSLNIEIEATKGQFIKNDSMSESKVSFVTNIDGYGEIGYRPNPGKNKVKFKVEAEGKTKEFELEIVGEKQDFFVNGIIEGRYNFNKNKDVNFFFQKDIDSYKDVYYRGAVYSEGNIDNIGYLTMTYDTDKDNQDRYFGYKNPEDYYPIFGDNSTKGYVGKSKDNLYLKLERDQSYILYGDYKTGELLEQRLRLGKFNRTLTGLVTKYESDKILATTFVAKTSNVKYVEEFPAEGVSGPYKLDRRDIVEGSETVTIVVYNRFNGLVIDEVKMVSGQDYTIEYDFGRLYFSEPIPSMDLDFNPIKIKVSYEVEDESGEKSYVYGGEGNYKLTKDITVGVSHFKDTRDMQEQEISNVSAIYENEKLLTVLEYSPTKNELGETGEAISVFSKYENEKIKGELIYEKSSLNYDNTDSILEGGIHRGKFEFEYSLEEKGKIKLDSLLEERINDSGTSEKKMDSYLGYETEWIKSFKYEFGMRQYIKKVSEEIDKVYTVGGRITWEESEEKKLKLFLEAEQGIENSDEKRLAVGADYKVFEQTSFYVRHELVSDLGEFFYQDQEESSNRTILGVKTIYKENEIYSEYREKNDEDSILPEMGYGIKRTLELSENLKLFGTFERITPFDKNSAEETSVTFGYDYETEKIGRFRGEIELEIEEDNSILNKLSYGKQFTENLYFITKNRYYTGDSEKENRFLLGLAYRDIENNRYQSLNKYESNYSKNIVEDGYTKLTHILRSSHNYQSSERAEETLTVGIKNTEVSYDGIKSNYTAYLVAGEIAYTIFDKWTAGINAATIFDDKEKIEYGLGAEIGYVFKNNLWLSTGYNFLGIRDKDFDPAGELNKGAYVRFRMNIGDIFDGVKK